MADRTLTAHETAILEAVITRYDVREAARIVGCDEATVRRTLAAAHVGAERDARRREALEAAHARLLATIPAVVGALERELATPGPGAVQAARLVLEYVSRYGSAAARPGQTPREVQAHALERLASLASAPLAPPEDSVRATVELARLSGEAVTQELVRRLQDGDPAALPAPANGTVADGWAS